MRASEHACSVYKIDRDGFTHINFARLSRRSFGPHRKDGADSSTGVVYNRMKSATPRELEHVSINALQCTIATLAMTIATARTAKLNSEKLR